MPSYREPDDRDRRGKKTREERDPTRDRDRERGGPSSRSGRGGGGGLNEYWIDGEHINREVLQKQICKMLGPEAFSRPSVYNGVRGFMLTAVRPFTPEQLDDLIRFSEEYESEKKERGRRGQQDVPYGESQTVRRHDDMMSTDDYPRDRYAPPTSYTTADSYSSTAGFAPPPGMPYGSGSAFPIGPSIPQEYQVPGYPTSARPGPSEPPYPPYRESFPEQYIPPSREALDRYSERDPRDIRDMRDVRMNPRAEPRAPPRGYPTYAAPPSGAMHDTRYHDDDRDEYMTGIAPPLSARGGYAGSSRPTTNGSYNPRDSPREPQMRDPYRMEPIRDDGRRRR